MPAEAPTWATDRGRLWNEVEKIEKRKDAQLARSITAALPRELDLDQQIALVRAFVEENFTSRGMIADVALHESVASDGLGNPHCHIMLTLRDVDRQGFGPKNRTWNATDQVTDWRESWEALTNAHLATAGSAERLSLRSYEAQGIVREPQFHLGYAAAGLEQDGWVTRRGTRLRELVHRNELRDLVGDLVGDERGREADAQPAGRWLDAPALTPATRHTLAVAAVVEAGLDRAAEAASQLVTQVGRWWEQTIAAGRETFDRVAANWADQERERVPDPERGIER